MIFFVRVVLLFESFCGLIAGVADLTVLIERV